MCVSEKRFIAHKPFINLLLPEFKSTFLYNHLLNKTVNSQNDAKLQEGI